MEVTKEEEINSVSIHKPHLVILGAGASRQASQTVINTDEFFLL
jgi:hypothetical protein